MKFSIYTLLAVVIFFLSGCQQSGPEIHFINLYTTTVIWIPCENLKKSGSTQTIMLSDEENDRLTGLFSRLQPVDKNLNIDARMYGFVYSRTEKLDFCLSASLIEINTRKFLVSPELRNFLVELTDKSR